MLLDMPLIKKKMFESGRGTSLNIAPKSAECN